MNLQNLRVWLTGASSGIGEALAEALAGRGARLAITARLVGRLQAVAARCAARSAPPVLVVPADVTDRAGVVVAVTTIEAALGGIDLAILNAGGHTDPLYEWLARRVMRRKIQWMPQSHGGHRESVRLCGLCDSVAVSGQKAR